MANFPPTEWTQILGAISSGGTIDQGRIERICDGYYRPIAAYINSICPGYHDAQDLTQEFMAGLSRGLYVGKADPSAGRFRAFLCQCALNFARAEWRKRSAIKRGGDSPHIEFDDERCAAAVLPATEEFDRAWVEVVVERTLESLRSSFERREKGRVVECLIEGLGWSGSLRSTAELAAAAGMTPRAFATALHRFRRAFRQSIRDEVRRLVSTEDELEEEIGYYLRLASSQPPAMPVAEG